MSLEEALTVHQGAELLFGQLSVEKPLSPWQRPLKINLKMISPVSYAP